ncbi:MAG TPA: AMP-binding protein [Azospirillum sp.]|nr:AMP-binding protein [Azospirillum sp.]
MSIVARLLDGAARHGERPFVLSDQGTVTWGEMAERTLRLSSALAAQGIGPGSHVGLMCSNRPAFLVAWFAIANRGAVTVPVNTGLVGEGLRYTLRQSDSAALVIEDAILEEKRADLGDLLDGLTVLSFADDDALTALAAGFPPDAPFAGDGTEDCTIIYTSGTTGLPKGVLNSHCAYLACGRATAEMLALGPDDRIMVFLPLFHTNPQMYAVMSVLETGAALVLRPRFSVSAFFDDARRFGATGFTYVGTVLAMLTARLRDPDREHGLRFCIGGGAPAEVWRLVEERYGITVHELYGMTEIGGWVTGNSLARSRFGTCGPARADMEVRVVDPHDRPVPPGERGEIVVRPREPFVILSGYYRNPEATLAASRNLWFHTGDSGSFDADGFLSFHGRLKEIIRRGGENISPVAVEVALLDHPDVEDAAVVGVPDPIFGEEVKAVLVVRRPIDPAAVPAFLRGRLPDFMLPRYVQFVDRIPKTETQKIQRHVLLRLEDGVIDLRPS